MCAHILHGAAFHRMVGSDGRMRRYEATVCATHEKESTEGKHEGKVM